MTTKKATYNCPECGRKFGFPKTLGSHRRIAHGVLGKSDSAIRDQQKRALHPLPTGPFPCPDCDFVAVSKAGLTIHRKAQHKAASTSKTAVAIRASSDPMQCPHCEFYAANNIGLANHQRSQHGVASANQIAVAKRAKRVELKAKKKGLPIEPAQTVTAVAVTSNGHHPRQEAHFAANGIPESTLALALGRFQELCRSISAEHDLPPRSFAAGLARLIYATTLR